MRLAVLFHRLGPYHLARLRVAAAAGEVVAVELSQSGGEYAWAAVDTAGLTLRTVCTTGDSNDLPPAELVRRVEEVLADLRPDVLAVAGWSDRGMLAAARWGGRTGRPMVLMSDSQWHDDPRVWWKEAIKRQVVGGFGAGFAAGTRHVDYLTRLGMPADRVRIGYDVVDNEYFAAGASAARSDPSARQRLGLPDRYFLNCARFVPKKNHTTLLDAYAAYRSAAGAGGWNLVLVGDGPLRPAVEGQIARLGLGDAVKLAGFLQYPDLPAVYGLASALVLPSVQEQWGLVVNEAMAAGLPVLASDICGAAPDLITEGETGYTFAPTDTRRLAELMGRLAADPVAAERMGERGRERVAGWGLGRFVEGLWSAARLAEPRRPTALRSAVFHLLVRA